ncbi:MAG: DUF11 domain-containing protein, partial [Bacteroidetes bacterium]
MSTVLSFLLPLRAEGVRQLAPSAEDMVMLLIGDTNYGNFAVENGPESSRLYFQLQSADELLYIGLSQAYTEAGRASTPGNYRFQIKRASDDAIVHGPYSVNSFSANLQNWEDAIGPDVLNGGQGYAVSEDRFRFAPQAAGTYYIEFLNVDHIGYWDFTVAANGQAIPGRVYSKNWAMRTPFRENQTPDCVWDREFNGTLFSYTDDGFVTRIDFADSGLQPLSFTLAFNTRGPGNSGDLGLDRMSLEATNATNEVAEHFIFLREPDPLLFPDGDCGQANVAPFFECTGPNTYCLEVSVTQPGQVEILLDFNQNGTFDDGLDRRLLHRFEAGGPLRDCLDWDGLLGDGSVVDPGTRINLLVQYTQGVQHWALYDGEYLKEGFCVQPIRPVCNNGELTDILYWDDRSIVGESGTGQPKDGRAGCACGTPACRTWDNFSVNRDCNDIDDNVTTGYGDKNTLNTWWFANVVAFDLVDVPLIDLTINGAAELCLGGTTTLDFTFTSTADIATLTWEGPNGVLFSGPNAPLSIQADLPGLYVLTVEDAGGCVYTDSHLLTAVNCATDVELDITVNNSTPQICDTVNYTITLTNQGPDLATGIDIEAAIPAGLSNVHAMSLGGVFQNGVVRWDNLSLLAGQNLTLTFSAKVEPAFDYTVHAEVTDMDQPDLDSTPGNGVDTNGNSQCADDLGDEDDGDCVTLNPADCSISISITNLECDPNGTPDDGSDDLFTFDLTVNGDNGAETWTGTLAGSPISGAYGESQSFGPYAIRDGALTVMARDAFFTNSCTASATVTPPASCSDGCRLSIEQRNTQCLDNGTPFDGADDTYTVEVRLTGSNTGAGWYAFGGAEGAYGEWVTIGPFLIADGNVTMNFVDEADPNCSINEEFRAPPSCSDDCQVLIATGTPVCDDNGTPSDDRDDTFTFTLTVTGDNVSATWEADDADNTSGSYGQTLTMGPYAIADGDIVLTISDTEDDTCPNTVTIEAPQTCSPLCEMSIEQRNTQCLDNGTPFDGADDTYTVEVRLTGFNTGTGWDAFGGFSGAYDEWVTIGPFLIADGNVIMNFVDNADPACSVNDEFVAPPACSNTCRLEAVAGEAVCDDNGTPSDPSDDTYTFQLTVTGDNTSATWRASDPNATTGTYGEPLTMGPYAIAAGDLNLTITDSADGLCMTNVNVSTPPTCSDLCVIDAIELVGEPQCLDNDTPTMAGDDRFSFSLRVSGRNTGGGWNAVLSQGGQNLTTITDNYDEVVAFGEYLITDGPVVVTVTDLADGNCTNQLTIDPPSTCSNTCDITEVLVSTPLCDDQGTPTEPGDDTFTFTVEVNGLNVASSWNSNLGVSGAYGLAVSFGPYAIANGDLSLTISDAANGACQETVTITAPATCSDECAIDASFSNVVCHNNDTPFDPADDTYTFDLLVTSINAAGDGWRTNVGGSGSYGEVSTQGPYLIADGVLNLVVSDNSDPDCTSALTITPPASCSDECRIDIEVISVDCDDAGTEDDSSDDTFTYTVLVSGQNTGDTWTASDGTTGAYGQIVSSQPYPYSQGTITVVVTDESGRCSNSFTVSPPAPELICPEDTHQRSYSGRVQILRGQLDEEDDVFTEPPCFLAASSNPMTLGDRFFDAIIIYTPDTDVPSDTTDAVYTFHLFTNMNLPDEARIEGATRDGSGVLVRGDYRAADDPCCFRMNYEDNTQGDGGLELSNPDIDTTGFFNQPMALVQKFKQTPKRGEELSLTVSTFGANNVGDYAWVISYNIADTLRLAPDETEVSSQVVNQEIYTDLTHLDLGWALHNPASLDAIGRATADPSCGVDDIYFSDVLDYADCENAYIYRTFVMEYGDNVDSCEQQITFRQAELSDLILPPSTVTIECGEEYPVDGFGNPSPRYTGYPLYDSGSSLDTLFDQVQYFNLEAFYKDSISIDTLNDQQVWEREWTIIDYCGDTTNTFRQLIKLGDFRPPVLDCPLSTHVCPILNEDIMLFGVDPFECTATVEVPRADFRGFCDPARALEWTITTELLWAADTTLLDTIAETGSRSVTNLGLGDYLVRYSATHADGERTERYCRIRVADLQPPQAICETTLTVDLAEGNTVDLSALRVDRGSTDNCGSLAYAIRRQYERDADCNPLDEAYLSDWDDSVFFSCCDINQFVAVDFRVMDPGGNMNGCALRVEVIDSSMPEVRGLEQQSLNCQALPAAFDPLDSLQRVRVFGQPELVNPCQETLVEMDPLLSWNDCELGQIERRFQIKDALGNLFDTVLVQRNIVTPSAFYSIRFPEDITTDCAEELPGIDWVGGSCSDFTVEVSDEVLEPSDEECYRLARTYIVTDNCRYDGTSSATVLSRDENCDGQEGEQALWLVATDQLAFADADSDANNSFPPAATSSGDCGPLNPTGYWRSLSNTGRWAYTQIIRIVDEVAPVVNYEPPAQYCATDATCTAWVEVSLLIEEFCLPDNATVSLLLDAGNDGTVDAELTNTAALQGSWPRYNIQGDYPVGTHAFVLNVTDGCGNSSVERIAFTIVDCYIEPAVCASNLEVNLEAVGQVRDLDGDGIVDEAAAIIPAELLADMIGMDCSGDYRYSVNEAGATIDFSKDELILTCEDRYQATIEVVVRDAAYNPYRLQPDSTVGGPNYSTCLIEITVQDEDEVCRTCLNNELEIGGGIYTTGGDPISGVRVVLEQIPDFYDEQTTGLSGSYLFEELPFSRNWKVIPSRTVDVTNGVSLMD